MAKVVTWASMDGDARPGRVCRISTARAPVRRPGRGSADRRGGDTSRARTGVPRHTATGNVAGMSTDARRDLGRAGEQLALEHLERLGYALVARNHRTAHGELDLVVTDGEVLVFVEVKTRRATRATSAGAVPGTRCIPASSARSAPPRPPTCATPPTARRPRRCGSTRSGSSSTRAGASCASTTSRERSEPCPGALPTRRARAGRRYSESCWYAALWKERRCSGETPRRWIASRCSGVE